MSALGLNGSVEARLGNRVSLLVAGRRSAPASIYDDVLDRFVPDEWNGRSRSARALQWRQLSRPRRRPPDRRFLLPRSGIRRSTSQRRRRIDRFSQPSTMVARTSTTRMISLYREPSTTFGAPESRSAAERRRRPGQPRQRLDIARARQHVAPAMVAVRNVDDVESGTPEYHARQTTRRGSSPAPRAVPTTRSWMRAAGAMRSPNRIRCEK